jgi:hypothetical protein
VNALALAASSSGALSRPLPSRWLASSLLFGGLLGGSLLGGLLAAVGGAVDVPAIVVLGVTFGFLAFTGVTVFAWFTILRSSKLLDEAATAVDGGDIARADANARWCLTWAFRGDVRFRALYTLALGTERAGDFEGAIALFRQAEAAVPAMAAPKAKAYVHAWTLAHTAFCHAVVGRRPDALADLGACHGELARMVGPNGLADAFFDDSGWGLGDVSMNETIMKVERKRPPRVGAALAGAILAYRDGAKEYLLQLIFGEQASPFLPPERALLTTMALRCDPNLPWPQDAQLANWAAGILDR